MSSLLPESGVSPLREVWSIAWPTVLTMTSYTVMQFVDKLLLGQVGALELAAQGNGGIWTFTPLAFVMGGLTVVNTYVAQNLGAGRPERGPQYAWASVWVSVVIWLLVALPWLILLEDVFGLVHAAQSAHIDAALEAGEAWAEAERADLDRLITLETRYGRILLAGSLFLLAGRGIHHYFFGLHRPKIITVSALCGNVTNALCSYALIFGAAGLTVFDEAGGIRFQIPGVPGVPSLGIVGAGIGTVVGTLVEFAIPFAVFLGRDQATRYGSRRAWRPAWRPIRDLVRLGWPAAVQMGNEIVCWSIFMTTLVGLFGTRHQTAGWIALSYMHLSFMPAVGFSVAVTSLVGRYIGAGAPDIAAARARLGVGITMVYMTACGAAFFIFREPLVALFIGRDPDAAALIEIGARLMICAAIFQTVDALGIVYTGALRGAGDTVWPGVVTIIYSWVFIVGGGWLMTVVWPELESVGPWIGASVYIVIFGLTMAIRFERGRWRSIRLVDGSPADEAARVAPLGPGPPAPAEATVRDRVEEIGRETSGDA